MRRALMAGVATVAASLPSYFGGGALIPLEPDAMGIKFNYDGGVASQMRVITSSVIVDSDPFASLTYTAPNVKLCRQSDGVMRHGRHNFLLQSQTFDNASWTKSEATISANAATAPDGTLTADKIQENTNSALHQAVQTYTVQAGKQYQASCFFKADDRSIAQMYVEGGSSWYGRQVNLNDGSFQSAQTASGSEVTMVSHTVTSMGSGWYHSAIVFTATVTTVQMTIRCALAGGGEFGVGVNGAGFFIWGAMARLLPAQTVSPLVDYMATTTAIKVALPYEWSTAGVLEGVMPEDARTNLCLRNQDFSNGSWVAPSFGTAPTVTANSTVAPDGTTTADTLNDTNAASFQGLTQAITVNDTSIYCASVYVLKDAIPRATRFGLLRWQSNAGVTSYDCCFDTSTGAVNSALGATAPISMGAIDCGLWWRFYIVGAASGAAGEFYVFPAVGASNFAAYVNTATGSAIFWGAQLELGRYPTSPIHNLALAVTRAIDNIFLPIAAYPHSDSVGTLITGWKNGPFTPSTLTYRHFVHASDGTSNERHVIYCDTLSANIKWDILDGGVSQTANGTIGTAVASAVQKAGLAYTLNNSAVCCDGGVLTADTACTMPTITTIRIGVDAAGTNFASGGYIREVSYFKRRLTNGELAEYTDPNFDIGALEDESWSFFARNTTAQVTARKTVYNTLIAALKAASILTKLDALWCFDAAEAATAVQNLLSSSFTASPVNSPSFSANAGYTLTGGSNHRINTTLNPTTGGQKYAQNDACFFAWCNTAAPALVDGGKIIMSGHEAVGGLLNNCRLYCQSYPGDSFGEINGNNSTDATSGATPDARGLHLMTRLNSTTELHHFNLNGGNSHASTSQAAESDTFTFGAIQTNERFSGVILGGGIGQGLTPTQVAALYAALRAYHVSVAGISVP